MTCNIDVAVVAGQVAGRFVRHNNKDRAPRMEYENVKAAITRTNLLSHVRRHYSAVTITNEIHLAFLHCFQSDTQELFLIVFSHFLLFFLLHSSTPPLVLFPLAIIETKIVLGDFLATIMTISRSFVKGRYWFNCTRH